MEHFSVLLNEAIAALNIKSDGIYVDCTLGLGGHSSKILERIPKGHLYAFDEDDTYLDKVRERLDKVGKNYTIINKNFRYLKEELEKMDVIKVDGILFDLGVSSPQIDTPERGFSYLKDGILDMRMDKFNKVSAKEVVNTYKEKDLTDIFFKYGEEKYSKRIANFIVNNRPINTTLELVNVIKKAVGANYFYKNNPERKIFQAIRIEVNKELDYLTDVLPDCVDLLNKNGRLVIITFHSLEDRIVKKFLKETSEVPEVYKGLPDIPKEYLPKMKLINKKPILPSKEEINVNSRSKSAKLRIGERLWKMEKNVKKIKSYLLYF